MKSEAMKTSAEFALNESRRSRDVREYIRHEPVTALAMAAVAGFIVSGEASARPGLALLAFIGQIAVREAATYFVIGTVVAVTEQEEISKIEAELDEAQHDLRDTLSEASAKAEHQEGALRPDRLVESYPIEASCLAGALGFIIGSRARPSAVGPVMIAALLGYAISRRLKE